MTQADFDKKYPNGLNKVIVLFSKSLYEIMHSEEIDRVINNSKGKEKRFLIKFKQMYNGLFKEWDVPVWLTLSSIKSTLLLQEVISYMILNSKDYYDDVCYHGESEDVEI